MFYFCDEPVPFPSLEDVDQLEKVVKFREELQRKGLTQLYPSREKFREYIRGDLLRAVRDLVTLETVEAIATSVPGVQPPPATPAEVLGMRGLSAEYDEARRVMKPGSIRTRKMTEIFAKMRSLAASVRSAFQRFKQSDSSGERLAAVAILQMFPNRSELPWLAERLDPKLERPFVGYQAAQALLQAVRSLPKSDCTDLRSAVDSALALAKLNPDDPPRILVLEEAEGVLERKCRAN